MAEYTHDIGELKDLNAEAAVIGTLMIRPDYYEYDESLKPKYFFDPLNSILFESIKELYLSGISNIDAFNLDCHLRKRDDYKRLLETRSIDTTEILIDLYIQVARPTKEEYVKSCACITTLAFKRDMSKFLLQTDRHLYRKKEESLAEVDNYINSSIDELIHSYESTADIERFGKKADMLYEEIKSRRNNDGTVGLPTKFFALQNYMSYEPAELVVVSARMKKGKSIWMMNECVNLLRLGVPVLYIETEMIDRSFLERMLAHLTGIDCNLLKRGMYPPEKEADIAHALEWIKRQPLYHIYEPGIKMEKVYSIARRLQRNSGLGFVIYDYMKCDSAETSVNYNLLGQMTNALKNDIAGKLELPVLAGIQLNRNMEVADSDKISRYLSTLITIDAKSASMIDKDGQECGNYYMKVLLNRNGPSHDISDDDDYIDLLFEGGVMRFNNCKQHENDVVF